MVGHLRTAHTALAAVGACTTAARGTNPLPALGFQEQSVLLGTMGHVTVGGRPSCPGTKPVSSPAGEASLSREGWLTYQSVRSFSCCAGDCPGARSGSAPTMRCSHERCESVRVVRRPDNHGWAASYTWIAWASTRLSGCPAGSTKRRVKK